MLELWRKSHLHLYTLSISFFLQGWLFQTETPHSECVFIYEMLDQVSETPKIPNHQKYRAIKNK